MKLQDVFDALRYGELSQLSVGGQPAGVVNESNWEPLLNHLNLGLTTLYKRFLLKTGRLQLQLIPLLYLYRLHSDHSVHSTRAVDAKFILDTPQMRFRDDLIKVEKVFSDDGREYSLNDPADPWGMTTPSLGSLLVPRSIVDQDSSAPDWARSRQLQLVYRAGHPRVATQMGYLDPERVELELPESHLEALLLFIAARVNNNLVGNGEFHAGNNFAAKFEAECARLEHAGLALNPGQTVDRLRAKGWV